MESYHGGTIFAILESPPTSLLLVCFCKLLLALGAIIPSDSQMDNASADCRSLAVSAAGRSLPSLEQDRFPLHPMGLRNIL